MDLRAIAEIAQFVPPGWGFRSFCGFIVCAFDLDAEVYRATEPSDLKSRAKK
jgi:hypothetical protein